MKEEIDFFDDVEDNQRNSDSKKFLSRDILTKQSRNMKRMHSNSILHELRLNQKINQGNEFDEKLRALRRFQNPRNNSIAVIRSRRKFSGLNFEFGQKPHKHRISQFFELESKRVIQPNLQSKFANLKKSEKNTQIQNKQNEAVRTQGKEQKKFVIHLTKNKKKNFVKQPQPRNLILSSIKSKLREIDIISKRFDKANQFHAIQSVNSQNYNQNSSETFKILKQFGNKLNLRKNKITERRNSSKKNTKMQYRNKVRPKRYQTEQSEKQNSEHQNNCQGLWHQNARKMKNYISGGYNDQKQEYSDFCDIEEYRNLKNNFRTFEQIYNSIKEDKDNPIGKINKSDLKQPNILQVVSVMEKQHQISAPKRF